MSSLHVGDLYKKIGSNSKECVIKGILPADGLIHLQTKGGRFFIATSMFLLAYERVGSVMADSGGDYDWYFGDSGYSFDKGGSNREEDRSTGWPCGGSSHVFPNTGMKKSWCKWCGEEGEFMVATGKYEAVTKPK
jgi:hypothetical protein